MLVTRFVVRGSIEERVVQIQARKQAEQAALFGAAYADEQSEAKTSLGSGGTGAEPGDGESKGGSSETGSESKSEGRGAGDRRGHGARMGGGGLDEADLQFLLE